MALGQPTERTCSARSTEHPESVADEFVDDIESARHDENIGDCALGAVDLEYGISEHQTFVFDDADDRGAAAGVAIPPVEDVSSAKKNEIERRSGGPPEDVRSIVKSGQDCVLEGLSSWVAGGVVDSRSLGLLLLERLGAP